MLLDYSKPFEIVYNASVTGIGTVLPQEGRPVVHESKKLSSAEVDYSTGEQELFAVIHAMKTWRRYLEGVRVINLIHLKRVLDRRSRPS